MMYSPSGSVLVKNPPEMQETQVDAGLIINTNIIKNINKISITSDMQMTPPLWQKVKRN